MGSYHSYFIYHINDFLGKQSSDTIYLQRTFIFFRHTSSSSNDITTHTCHAAPYADHNTPIDPTDGALEVSNHAVIALLYRTFALPHHAFLIALATSGLTIATYAVHCHL